jgi:hypothetical protein
MTVSEAQRLRQLEDVTGRILRPAATLGDVLIIE